MESSREIVSHSLYDANHLIGTLLLFHNSIYFFLCFTFLNGYPYVVVDFYSRRGDYQGLSKDGL